MSGVHGCCSFNCLPPILNLILIAFIDIFEIILNFLKFDADILEKKIYDEDPALAIINIFLHTISLFSSFATMLNKKNMKMDFYLFIQGSIIQQRLLKWHKLKNYTILFMSVKESIKHLMFQQLLNLMNGLEVVI